MRARRLVISPILAASRTIAASPSLAALACIVALTTSVGAQDRQHRRETSLDGLWQLRVLEGKVDAAHVAAKVNGWRDIYVPSAFESVLGKDFDGRVVYRCRLAAPPPARGERVFVRFAAVMTAAKVRLNGRELGSHLGGWTPFRVELPRDAFAEAPNQILEVEVDERVGHNTQGFLPDIQPHFGGIWQSVTLQRYRGAGFDPDRVELHAIADAKGRRLRVRSPYLAQGRLVVTLVDPHNGRSIKNKRGDRGERGERRGRGERGGRGERRGRGRRGERQEPGDSGAFDEDSVIAAKSWRLGPAGVPQSRRGRDAPPASPAVSIDVTLPIPDKVELWSPIKPRTYEAIVEFEQRGVVRDRIRRRVGFRHLAVDGRKLSLNGEPLNVRGVLHWGYNPPTLEPNPPRSVWRQEMRWAKRCGFNTIKACLWLPPKSFFEVALEEGMLVWQEYPAWHPDFSAKHRDALLREYDEFFRYDRALTPIIVRSLTCETGRGAADEKVIKALYERCKKVTGAALVEDDSSWITWNRFSDIYDDHPYGNNSDWLRRLDGFDAHIKKHGPKPFLLGEAIAGDTWVELDALDKLLAGRKPWWIPFATDSMRDFEAWLARLDQLRARSKPKASSGAVRRLVEESKAYAMALRKYQIETFRRRLPNDGYIVSVMRDFRRARMGFFDDLGKPKWGAEDFAWHGRTMLVLDDARPIRSLVDSADLLLTPMVSLIGTTKRDVGERTLRRAHAATPADLVAWAGERAPMLEALTGDAGQALEVREGETNVAGPAMSGSIYEFPKRGPTRMTWTFDVEGLATSRWSFWVVPKSVIGAAAKVPTGVKIERTVTAELLDWVADGGRLLLEAGGKGGPKNHGHWYLRGAPFAPIWHPLFEQFPRQALFDLQPFDLEGTVIKANALTDAFETVFGFWDSHDQRERIARYAFLLEARVGKGRILITSLSLDQTPELPFDSRMPRKDNPNYKEYFAPNPARAWLRKALLDHLAKGRAPKRELSAAQIALWKRALVATKAELGGVWLLQPDKGDVGKKQGWMKPGFDDAKWIKSRAGAHWEAAGLPHHDGIAWYRKRFETPADWKPGEPLYAIFDGVDDSYELYVNGRFVARFGDPATGETVWLVRTLADIQAFAKPGKDNVLALRVVDHNGAGGLHRKVWLSKTKPEFDKLLNR